MNTVDFNILDRMIAYLRLLKVRKHIDKNDVVLDFGCGRDGYFLRHVQRRISLGIGIDYDFDTTTQDKNIILRKQKIECHLPYEGCFFDKIVLLAVLEHIAPEKIHLLFGEFVRVLKPSGKILITVPTPFGKPILDFLGVRLQIINRLEIEDHKKYYGYDDFVRLASSLGLEIVSYKTFQFGINSFCILAK